jgi:hypothetical protein
MEEYEPRRVAYSFSASAPAGNAPSVFTLRELVEEMDRARAKFPSPKFLFTALVEEVGEVGRALLQDEGRERVRKEALQVACVALRIYEESDPLYDNMAPEAKKK